MIPKYCVIGSRSMNESMKLDLFQTLKNLSNSSKFTILTGGCAGISLETIRYCVDNGLCSEHLQIWLAKKIYDVPKIVKPVIDIAISRGAKVIESTAINYLNGIIVRNKEMISESSVCYAWRLNQSKGTSHELAYAVAYNKPIHLKDYNTIQLNLPLFENQERDIYVQSKN